MMPLALLPILLSAMAIKTLSVFSLVVIVHRDPVLAYPVDLDGSDCPAEWSTACRDQGQFTAASLSRITQPMCGLAGENKKGCLDSRENFGVLQYQMQLQRHCSSLPSDFADGKEGPSTRAALKQFQATYGLTPDGVYGPKTAEALAGPVNGKCL